MGDADIVCAETLELGLVPTDIEVSTETAFKIPFDQLPALGVAFSAIADVFQTATGGSGQTLFTATNAFGKAIDPAKLQRFNDGTGLLGSIRNSEKGVEQVRLHVAGVEGAGAAVASVDPMLLICAAVLMQVNQKLDAIQQTQEEIFEYLRDRDKAELRGSLQALTDIMRDYRFNWQNEMFLANSHMKTFDIREKADVAATHLRLQVKKELGKQGFLETRFSVGDRLNKIVDMLREYRLSVYLYAFASFLDPLMTSSFDADYLASISERVSAHALAYRELYSSCYEKIESLSGASVDALLLGGVSGASKALGDLVSHTPLGEMTPIDDALLDAGDSVEKFNDDVSDSLLKQLRKVKSPGITPFQDGITGLNRLHNDPMAIVADSEGVYLLDTKDLSTHAVA